MIFALLIILYKQNIYNLIFFHEKHFREDRFLTCHKQNYLKILKNKFETYKFDDS